MLSLVGQKELCLEFAGGELNYGIVLPKIKQNEKKNKPTHILECTGAVVSFLNVHVAEVAASAGVWKWTH